MQNLAKYVFKNNKWFEEYHTIDAKGPIRLDYDTDITALVFVNDPELNVIETAHGQVQFLQIVGISTEQYEALKQCETQGDRADFISRLKIENPLLITDLNN